MSVSKRDITQVIGRKSMLEAEHPPAAPVHLLPTKGEVVDD